jgi:outer membrane protein assembly factor BamB
MNHCCWVCWLLLALFPLKLAAEDWPQFRGPERDGCSREKGLLPRWPAKGPKLLWTYRNAGLGHSSVAVVGDRLYTLGTRGDATCVLCLDARSGKELWHTPIGPIFTFEGNVWGDGPRSTPTVDGSLLYVLDGDGTLVCLETAGGKEVWRHQLVKELGGEMMSQWGYSESPLVDGEQLVCTPGGPQGTVAAFDKKTGRLLWRSRELKDKATYASLRLWESGGVRQYVVQTYVNDATGSMVAGVAAADGRLLWRAPFHPRQTYAMATMPLFQKHWIYVTSGYGAGCRLYDVQPHDSKFQAKELYTSRTQKLALKNTHGGVVLVDGYVYGHSEGSGWVCQHLQTGKVAWAERHSKLEGRSGSILYGDGRLYLYSEEGVAVLLKPSPAGWEEAGRFTIPERSQVREKRDTSRSAGVWAHPAIAHGRLYLRDQELIFCYDIRAAGP